MKALIPIAIVGIATFVLLAKKSAGSSNGHTTPRFKIGDYVQFYDWPTGPVLKIIAMEWNVGDSTTNPPIPTCWNYLLKWIENGDAPGELFEESWYLDPTNDPYPLQKINYP